MKNMAFWIDTHKKNNPHNDYIQHNSKYAEYRNLDLYDLGTYAKCT